MASSSTESAGVAGVLGTLTRPKTNLTPLSAWSHLDTQSKLRYIRLDFLSQVATAPVVGAGVGACKPL